jgi:hypothetical protein
MVERTMYLSTTENVMGDARYEFRNWDEIWRMKWESTLFELPGEIQTNISTIICSTRTHLSSVAKHRLQAEGKG